MRGFPGNGNCIEAHLRDSHSSGTRVPVDLIVGKLAGGMKYDEIVQEYDITQKDILECDKGADAIIICPPL